MKYHALLVPILLAGSLLAQSSTLPKGWDTIEGVEVGTTTESNFFAGFDILSGTTTYNPARMMFLYDATEFPWDNKVGTILQKLSFRRDVPTDTATRGYGVTTTAHTKDWTIIISTTDKTPAQCNFHLFDDNHGTNRAVVFGAIGTGKTVTFKATAAPTTGTAPFDVEVTLDTIFSVPKDTKTLVIEIRSYKATATTGYWRADSVSYPNNGNLGRYVVTNTDHCVSPSIFYTDRPMMTGSNWGHIWRSQLSPGGKTVLTWLGKENFNPYFKWPGTACNVHVFPPLLIRGDVSGTSRQYAAYIDWGKIPLNANLVGASVGHQSLFDDSQYPGGLALTRGGVSTVGSGYDPLTVKSTQLYSYGATNNSGYTANTDPDNEVHPRYFFRRAPIIKVN